MNGATLDENTAISRREIEKRIGYSFENRALLTQALTHKSYTNEVSDAPHNERMEFLGDSVLSLVVVTHLMQTHPEEREGMLTRRRASVVSEQALYRVAQKHRLGEGMLLGVGQAREGREHRAITADVVEAIIGAVYLDAGYDAASAVTKTLLGDLSGNPDTGELGPKTKLQELFQKAIHQRPTYEVQRGEGPDHAPLFSAQAMLLGRVLGQGQGASKKESTRNAAEDALEKYSEYSDEKLIAEFSSSEG